MDIKRAKELLAILADGIDPMTGEVLPAEDNCNKVEIVRALHRVLAELDTIHAKTKKLHMENAGKPWTGQDEIVLCRMFEAGSKAKDICAYFKRSQGAIAARLVKHGKIKERREFDEK